MSEQEPNKQKGAAGPLLVLVLVLVGITIMLTGLSQGDFYHRNRRLHKEVTNRNDVMKEKDMRKLKGKGATVLEPEITIEMRYQPEHNDFARYLTFQDHTGAYKRLKVEFRKKHGLLVWESVSFPNGIGVLESMAEPGNRSYWDRMYLENRGGTTMLPIKHLTIIMNYDNPSGRSPDDSNHVVNGIHLSGIDHAKIPLVDVGVRRVNLRSGYHLLRLDGYRARTLYGWAGISSRSDPAFVRAAARDFGKSGSDWSDNYGSNPKYGSGNIDLHCSEFVSWYYYQYGITVNGRSLRDIDETKELHNLFRAAGKLYRYNSGNYLQDFVHTETGEIYYPQPGDFLERRGPGNKPEHSMMILRWLPKDPSSRNHDDQFNQALVINGPNPVTLRLVKIHKDETATGEDYPKDYFLGRID